MPRGAGLAAALVGNAPGGAGWAHAIFGRGGRAWECVNVSTLSGDIENCVSGVLPVPNAPSAKTNTYAACLPPLAGSSCVLPRIPYYSPVGTDSVHSTL